MLHCIPSVFFFFLLTQGSQDYTASIFTGEEEIFAFERTVSRLIEMQGEEYWSLDRTKSSRTTKL